MDTKVRPEHSSKALRPIKANELGSVIEVILVHPKKVPIPIETKELGRPTEKMPSQTANASSAMILVPSAITRLPVGLLPLYPIQYGPTYKMPSFCASYNPEFSNAFVPIFLKELGKEMDVRLLQLLKALWPIEVKQSGKVTDVKLEHPEKDPMPMNVKELPNSIVVRFVQKTCFAYYFNFKCFFILSFPLGLHIININPN